MDNKYTADEYTADNAFPCDLEYGMSLLDYFAAKALPQVISSLSKSLMGRDVSFEDSVAKQSYSIARAMIRAKINKGD